jgi:hypothetical protein
MLSWCLFELNIWYAVMKLDSMHDSCSILYVYTPIHLATNPYYVVSNISVLSYNVLQSRTTLWAPMHPWLLIGAKQHDEKRQAWSVPQMNPQQLAAAEG